MKNLIKLIASSFYVGYLPVIPGTCGTAFALGIYLLIRHNFWLYTFVLFAVCVLGFLVSGRAEKIFQEKDSGKIVIDEVAGLLLSFWTLRLDAILIFAGFFIFRAMDAIKVYPANKLEKLNGSAGVMGDDIVAGLYTNLILQIVTRVLIR